MGAALALAQAPLRFWPMALIIPGLLHHRLHQKAVACHAGLCFGLGYFGLSVSWVFVSIHTFGNTPLILSVLLTLLFILTLSLFTLSQFFTYSLLQLPGRVRDGIYFSLNWVAWEWLRSWLFTGFPWAYLGMSQINTPFKYYAPLGSVYLVSGIVCFLSVCIISTLKGPADRRVVMARLACLITLTTLCLPKDWTEAESDPQQASLIQGNIKPFDKFAQADPIAMVEQIYVKLSLQHPAPLILWPEAAIPIAYPEANPLLASLDSLAKNRATTLISGLPILEGSDYYNGLIALGLGQGQYRKQKLVPFGDYLPFERQLRGLIGFFDIPMSSQKPGRAQQRALKLPGLKAAPFICYEIAFPKLVADSLANAELVITLSEDGWFGRSFGPHQHLDLARMRALETGRDVLRATTSGISAFINSRGEVTQQAPQFTAQALIGYYHKRSGTTPWLEWGRPGWQFVIAISFISHFFLRTRS